MAGRKGAPRDPKTGRYVSIDQVLAQAQKWYGTKDETPKQFAQELLVMVTQAPRLLEDVVDASCQRIQKEAKANVLESAPIHNAGAYKGIDYEVNSDDAGDVWGDVGYNPKRYRPAHLGNLLEFGGGGDPSPPHWDLWNALQEEAPRFRENIADLGEAMIENRWYKDNPL
jgi:hypothetical protein